MSGKGKAAAAASQYLSDPRLVDLYNRWMSVAEKALDDLTGDDGELTIEPEGGQQKIAPLVKVAETATVQARMLATELGLTAAAIARGAAGRTAAVDDDDDAPAGDSLAGRPGRTKASGKAPV